MPQDRGMPRTVHSRATIGECCCASTVLAVDTLLASWCGEVQASSGSGACRRPSAAHAWREASHSGALGQWWSTH